MNNINHFLLKRTPCPTLSYWCDLRYLIKISSKFNIEMMCTYNQVRRHNLVRTKTLNVKCRSPQLLLKSFFNRVSARFKSMENQVRWYSNKQCVDSLSNRCTFGLLKECVPLLKSSDEFMLIVRSGNLRKGY